MVYFQADKNFYACEKYEKGLKNIEKKKFWFGSDTNTEIGPWFGSQYQNLVSDAQESTGRPFFQKISKIRIFI